VTPLRGEGGTQQQRQSDFDTKRDKLQGFLKIKGAFLSLKNKPVFAGWRRRDTIGLQGKATANTK